MLCSPSHLLIDMTLWYSPGVYEMFVETFHDNRSGYDCGLTSVQCDSNITAALVTSQDSLFYWFDMIVINVLLTSLVVVGLFGNIANIVIFATTNIASDSTNNLLLAISVSDLCNLLVSGTLVAASALCYIDEATALTFFNISFAQNGTASRFLSLLSLDFVTLISIQRACAVLLPFKVAAIFSRRRTNILIGSLVFAYVGANCFVSFAFFPRWVFHPYFNETISLGYSMNMAQLTFVGFLTYWVNTRSVIDLGLLFVTGFLTVVKLRSHARTRASLKATSNSNSNSNSTSNADSKSSELKMSAAEVGVVKMSLAVCLMTFVIYCLAITGNSVLQSYLMEIFTNPLPILCLLGIFAVNSTGSSFNFFLYLTMSTKFRSAFRIYFMFGKREKS